MDIGEEIRIIDVEEIEVTPIEVPIEIPEPFPAKRTE
jgi:hypothetical protein